MNAHSPGAARLFGIGWTGSGATMTARGSLAALASALVSAAFACSSSTGGNTPSHCRPGPYFKRAGCTPFTFARSMSACSGTAPPVRGGRGPPPPGDSFSLSGMLCSIRPPRETSAGRLASAFRARVPWNRDLVALGRRRHRAQHLGLVEELPLIGISLLGAGAKPLVRRQPQLLFEPFDLERLLAHERLQRSRIVRQIGR